MAKEFPEIVHLSRLAGQKEMDICLKNIVIVIKNEIIGQYQVRIAELEKELAMKNADLPGDDRDAGNRS